MAGARRSVLGLIGWVVVTFLAAAVGSIASVKAATFYGQLTQPSWAPPANVFGPVWSVLYVLMALAAWLVWRSHGFSRAGHALLIYLAQLLVNALWSWLFFGWHKGGLALADIALLWALVVAVLIAFWRVRPLAGALLVPYLSWISFALVLNYSVWQLNPQVLA
ncbi:TspO/MBR family protein [Lysobacter niabensis]|uniref:TspO/MBR family protein n=1 Tax=Agrilutibacter niabensis TaxID=380628 RepID=UPI00361ACB72